MNADRPKFAPRDPETMAEIGPLLIVKRLRRKAEVMRLDAARNSSLWYDLEEVLALVDIIAAQMGGEA